MVLDQAKGGGGVDGVGNGMRVVVLGLGGVRGRRGRDDGSEMGVEGGHIRAAAAAGGGVTLGGFDAVFDCQKGRGELVILNLKRHQEKGWGEGRDRGVNEMKDWGVGKRLTFIL